MKRREIKANPQAERMVPFANYNEVTKPFIPQTYIVMNPSSR